MPRVNPPQEVPASTNTATGTGTLIFDRATRNILITHMTHNVTNATMAHTHTSSSGAGGNGAGEIRGNIAALL